MKMLKISDEIYERLKQFVTDPFDDTPDAVIHRLIDIANKAKLRWSPFDEKRPGSLSAQEEELHEVVL